jgi:hypothetical protein
MDTQDYFFELKTKCSANVVNDLLEWCIVNMKEDLYPQYHWIQRLPPKAIIDKDPLLKYLHDDGWKAVLYRFIPNTFSEFHIDNKTNRPCALNIALAVTESHTLFKVNQVKLIEHSIAVLNYKPNTAYLLNTLKDHAVVNLNQDRYVLTFTPPRQYVDGNYTIEHTNVESADIEKNEWIYFEIRNKFKSINF